MSTDVLVRIETSINELVITADELAADQVNHYILQMALALQDLFILKETGCRISTQKQEAKRLLKETERLYRYMSALRSEELRNEMETTNEIPNCRF